MEEQITADNIVESDDGLVRTKPLSKNPVKAFFQRIMRWWLGKWYIFSEKHTKAAPFIYKVAFFLVFSTGVTIWQYIVMTFLPYAFASLNNGAWGWPNTPVGAFGGVPYIILGDASGMGYFIAFEIAVFTAQCINFPLQRNITYKSHDNPWYQAMWYFIGWLGVSLFTSSIWGICNCFLTYKHVPDAASGLIKTLITGIVSMVIYFFIFLVIFPDRQKQAEHARARFNKLCAKGAPEQKKSAAELKAIVAEENARYEKARADMSTAVSIANSKAIAWEAAKARLNMLHDKNAADAEVKDCEGIIAKRFDEAVAAAKKREEAISEFERIKSEVDSARAARAV